MSNFERKSKYIVIPLSDFEATRDKIRQYLPSFDRMMKVIYEVRDQRGKPDKDYVVVDSGMPIYEATWHQVEQVVTDGPYVITDPLNTISAVINALPSHLQGCSGNFNDVCTELREYRLKNPMPKGWDVAEAMFTVTEIDHYIPESIKQVFRNAITEIGYRIRYENGCSPVLVESPEASKPLEAQASELDEWIRYNSTTVFGHPKIEAGEPVIAASKVRELIDELKLSGHRLGDVSKPYADMASDYKAVEYKSSLECQAVQHSDQMVCQECDLTWDINSREEPQCRKKNR